MENVGKEGGQFAILSYFRKKGVFYAMAATAAMAARRI